MNFFEHQRQAKSKTSVLLFLFFLAVASIVLAIYSVIILTLTGFGNSTDFDQTFWVVFFNPEMFFTTVIIISSIILLASLFKSLMLRGGGKSVCEMLGAHLIDKNSKDFDERKYLNIVEEMSIASGVSMPLVYILEEDSINAFAAGHDIKNAAVCVTRGAIKKLKRDELQAVMAHEYGHIFNGDMKINIRLMGYIFGLLFLSEIGSFLVRSNRYSRRSSRDKGGGQIVVIGIAFWIFGFFGSVFASMIKAYISRQREFLADASAVQFTRNGPAMVNVFKKLLVSQRGSHLESPNATEVSHMFFTKGVKEMFSTHPPLVERIKRIDKGFNEKQFFKFENEKIIKELSATTLEENSEIKKNKQPPNNITDINQSAGLLAVLGTLPDQSIEKAHQNIQEIPKGILNLCHDLFGSKVIVCTYLLDSDDEIRNNQISHLEQLDLELSAESKRRYKDIASLDKKYRLTIIELCISSIKSLPSNSMKEFQNILDMLIKADNRINLFEILVFNLISEISSSKSNKPKGKSSRIKLKQEISDLLQVLVRVSSKDNAERDTQYTSSMEKLRLPIPDNCQSPSLPVVQNALKKIDTLHPDNKEKLLNQFVEIIMADNKMTYKEQELLRLLALSMSVPMPLL